MAATDAPGGDPALIISGHEQLQASQIEYLTGDVHMDEIAVLGFVIH
jgi:hypothetical protein